MKYVIGKYSQKVRKLYNKRKCHSLTCNLECDGYKYRVKEFSGKGIIELCGCNVIEIELEQYESHS